MPPHLAVSEEATEGAWTFLPAGDTCSPDPKALWRPPGESES